MAVSSDADSIISSGWHNAAIERDTGSFTPEDFEGYKRLPAGRVGDTR